MKHSFYFTDFNHSALERNAAHFKSIDIEHDRATIAKELEFILNDFVEMYKNNSNYLYNDLINSLELNHNKKPYPIIINNEKILLNIELFRKELEKSSNIKIEKIYFINLIIMKYYKTHSKEIIKRELDFWNSNFNN